MDALKNLLHVASSQDPRGLANAEQQLRSLEIQPGFHAALLVSDFCHWRYVGISNTQGIFRQRPRIYRWTQVLDSRQFCT